MTTNEASDGPREVSDPDAVASGSRTPDAEVATEEPSAAPAKRPSRTRAATTKSSTKKAPDASSAPAETPAASDTPAPDAAAPAAETPAAPDAAAPAAEATPAKRTTRAKAVAAEDATAKDAPAKPAAKKPTTRRTTAKAAATEQASTAPADAASPSTAPETPAASAPEAPAASAPEALVASAAEPPASAPETPTDPEPAPAEATRAEPAPASAKAAAPAEPAPAEEEATAQPAAATPQDAAAASARTGERAARNGRRVVVAEDEALIRLDVVETLTEAGFDVVGEAGDGEHAVTLATSLRPDVVVMDIKMPVLDGISAAERIGKARIAPVVLLTAFSQTELVERARDAGAMAYVVKPFTPQELLPAIEIAIARHAEITALEEEVADLAERFETRKRVERAKGLLMTKMGLTEPESFRWIQKTSMDRRLTMREVADAVIEQVGSTDKTR